MLNGKNSAATGINRVPSPKPENSVSAEASGARAETGISSAAFLFRCSGVRGAAARRDFRPMGPHPPVARLPAVKSKSILAASAAS
jgi:hypothetical protein